MSGSSGGMGGGMGGGYGGMGSPYGGMGGGYGGMGGGYGGQRRPPGPPSPWGQSGASLNYGSAPWMQQMQGPPSNDVMSGAAQGIPQLAGAGSQWLPNFNSATPQYYNAALWAASPQNPMNQQAQQQQQPAPFAPTAAQQGTWSPGATGGGAGDNLTAGAAQNWTSVPDLPYTGNASTNTPGSGQGGGQAAYQAYLAQLLQQQQQQQGQVNKPNASIMPITSAY